jgi:hypothetical protein
MKLRGEIHSNLQTNNSARNNTAAGLLTWALFKVLLYEGTASNSFALHDVILRHHPSTLGLASMTEYRSYGVPDLIQVRSPLLEYGP